MRIDIEPVNGRDGLAVRRSVKYHDGSVCRVDYLSFITGEWMQKEVGGLLPKECVRNDELIELLELGPRGKPHSHRDDAGIYLRHTLNKSKPSLCVEQKDAHHLKASLEEADQVTVGVDEKKNTYLLLRGSWASSMSQVGGDWQLDGALKITLNPHDEMTFGTVD